MDTLIVIAVFFGFIFFFDILFAVRETKDGTIFYSVPETRKISVRFDTGDTIKYNVTYEQALKAKCGTRVRMKSVIGRFTSLRYMEKISALK